MAGLRRWSDNIQVVNSAARFVAALMLAFMVPVQAGAAACAQLCATVAFQHHLTEATAQEHAGPVTAESGDGSNDGMMHGHDCDKSDAAGKCCQGHAVMTQGAFHTSAVLVPAFEREFFVARWTNFIPEEPSPPPISSSPSA